MVNKCLLYLSSIAILFLGLFYTAPAAHGLQITSTGVTLQSCNPKTIEDELKKQNADSVLGRCNLNRDTATSDQLADCHQVLFEDIVNAWSNECSTSLKQEIMTNYPDWESQGDPLLYYKFQIALAYQSLFTSTPVPGSSVIPTPPVFKDLKPTPTLVPDTDDDSFADAFNALLDDKQCGIAGNQCCGELTFPQPRIPTPDLGITNWLRLPQIIDAVNTLIEVPLDAFTEEMRDWLDVFRSDKLCLDGSEPQPTSDGCFCQRPTIKEAFLERCDQIGSDTAASAKEREACRTCINGIEMQKSNGETYIKTGVWTAVGCVDYEMAGFIQETIFGWGMGLAGVVVFLCIIYASFRLQTSQNNPEQIKEAQDLLTSCITGLIIIIFSVFILRVIGVDILQIPGLN